MKASKYRQTSARTKSKMSFSFTYFEITCFTVQLVTCHLVGVGLGAGIVIVDILIVLSDWWMLCFSGNCRSKSQPNSHCHHHSRRDVAVVDHCRSHCARVLCRQTPSASRIIFTRTLSRGMGIPKLLSGTLPWTPLGIRPQTPSSPSTDYFLNYPWC